MNITELARKLKVTTNQLHDVLPQLGFDIGRRAIKVDDTVASKIMQSWGQYQAQKLKAASQQKDETEKTEGIETPKPTIILPPVISVRDFAIKLNLPVTKVIQVLMNNGILAALNEKIDYETASIIAQDLGFKTEPEKEDANQETSTQDLLQTTLDQENKKDLTSRPPVVVIMGHVDHGKTKLLDAIRKTNVIAQESGGITQHIGAYQITKKMKDSGLDKTISFIDTPGHEAFTTMRSRGAKVADIAILVVAADDGVKPQTVEAYKILQAAGLPIIVAINKIDKPDANLDKVKREIADIGLIPEDWGGKTICVPISAKSGENIDTLLEMILLVAEMEKDKIVANPSGQTLATVVESHIDKNEGPVATILVQNGTLKLNDYLVVDNVLYGKVRNMKDHLGKNITTALPSKPVKIIGLKQAPVVGFIIKANKELDKSVEKEIKRMSAGSAVAVSPKFSNKEGEQSVNVLLRADTLGSLEAIANSLIKIDHPEVKVKIIAKDLGNITSADVLKAEATGGFVAGFHVTASSTANELAGEKGIEIKIYKIIYELIDDIKTRIEKILAPNIVRIEVGKAKILQIFRTESNGMILGCAVTEGEMKSGNDIKLIGKRGEVEIGTGKIKKLQSGKQEVDHIGSGQEFGMAFEGKPLLQVGDYLYAYREEKHARKLDD